MLLLASKSLAAVSPSQQLKLEVPQPNSKGQLGDDRVVFILGEQRYPFTVHVKRHVNVAGAVHLASRMEGQNGPPPLLLTTYVQPAVAEALQMRGVNYADLAGNCHIVRPPLFLHIEGRKRTTSNKKTPIRAFKGEGLKVIFVLLFLPQWVTRSYRDVADLSGVSHGVVQYTIKDLEQLGYIIRKGRTKRSLENLPDLLDRWVRAYTEHLRPKQSMGLFRFMPADHASNWKHLPLEPMHEHWGGESAAALLTGYLKPAQLTLYTYDTRPEVMKRLHIVPDEAGTLEVVRTFWTTRFEEACATCFLKKTVPPLLAYADLIASGDPRNAEVAALLREKI